MPFGLCNAPATFQRCMTAIFSDFCEKIVEVFMDDFYVYGKSFDDCLSNLDRVLQRCEQTNLVLNWEKCHFMVNESILLGHKISERGIEVDKAKVDAIEKMPCPKDTHFCFLDGYSGFSQIPVSQPDQEKTTFTCPFGTYAYRHMPFGLYNAPATFQRCMTAIFSDFCEKIVEVFMDDFSVYGKSLMIV